MSPFIQTCVGVLLLALAYGSYKTLDSIGYYYRNAYVDSCKDQGTSL